MILLKVLQTYVPQTATSMDNTRTSICIHSHMHTRRTSQNTNKAETRKLSSSIHSLEDAKENMKPARVLCGECYEIKWAQQISKTRLLVDRAGFEPATSALRRRRSYQTELPALLLKVFNRIYREAEFRVSGYFTVPFQC